MLKLFPFRSAVLAVITAVIVLLAFIGIPRGLAALWPSVFTGMAILLTGPIVLLIITPIAAALLVLVLLKIMPRLGVAPWIAIPSLVLTGELSYLAISIPAGGLAYGLLAISPVLGFTVFDGLDLFRLSLKVKLIVAIILLSGVGFAVVANQSTGRVTAIKTGVNTAGYTIFFPADNSLYYPVAIVPSEGDSYADFRKGARISLNGSTFLDEEARQGRNPSADCGAGYSNTAYPSNRCELIAEQPNLKIYLRTSSDVDGSQSERKDYFAVAENSVLWATITIGPDYAHPTQVVNTHDTLDLLEHLRPVSGEAAYQILHEKSPESY